MEQNTKHQPVFTEHRTAFRSSHFKIAGINSLNCRAQFCINMMQSCTYLGTRRELFPKIFPTKSKENCGPLHGRHCDGREQAGTLHRQLCPNSCLRKVIQDQSQDDPSLPITHQPQQHQEKVDDVQIQLHLCQHVVIDAELYFVAFVLADHQLGIEDDVEHEDDDSNQ